MASTDVISQVLDSITSTKLHEISKLRASFEQGKAKLLASVDAEKSQADKVRLLLDGYEELCSLEDLGAGTSLNPDIIRRFLEQARHDPSVSVTLQEGWAKDLRRLLDVNSLRFEYAAMYGNLVTEWLGNPVNERGGSEGAASKKAGREEMHEQRATWEAYVFNASETDTDAITAYLDGLFKSSKDVSRALRTLRAGTKVFSEKLATEIPFDEKSLDWCIKGLLSSDLLTDAKRSALNDFATNKIVLRELADVLNMRFKALDTWAWAPEGTPVEQRRQLNGRYRFYHDEDLLQSIFLRYIGVSWSVHFKAAFERFSNASEAWKATPFAMPKDEEARWEMYSHWLDDNAKSGGSVQAKQYDIWKEDVFLEQLQSRVDEIAREYNSDDTDDKSDDGSETKSPKQIVQTVLRVLQADIIIKTRIGEDITVVRSDFKWFGPSLSHSTMFAVLKYFGVSNRWISFFKRALEAPMQFVNDGPDSLVQVRKRGTPISGPLSDVLGESVLFCLDFAFNQRTNGALLWRLHDDIWFWGDQHTCETGWGVMTEFAELMGLEFAEDKTGSVQIAKDGERRKSPSSVLPSGDVVWGLLKLDADTGRFIINQEGVDKHVNELRLQLDSCKSVFDWIQAWNIYAARFLTTNFGRPCNAFGRAHVDEILETFEKIQKKLFTKEQGGSVTSVIKKMLSDRFGVKDIPEGYLYFSTSLGGLEVRNPFIEPCLIRDIMEDSPQVYMDKFFEAEERLFRSTKIRFDKDSEFKSAMINGRWEKIKKPDEFMSFDEYTRHRSLTSRLLAQAFDSLVTEESTESSLIDKKYHPSPLITERRWADATPYYRWIMQLYAPEMIARFGGLNVVQPGLLPMGMVSMFKKSRFQWAS